jgi:hypothetical protein
MKVNPLLLLVIPLLFLSGSFVNAGPVGDFFKKVGQSISKPFQPEPQPQSTPPPQPTKTPHATRRPTSREAPAAAATRPAVAPSPQPPKKEEFTGVRGVSAADMEKIKAGLPYGIPVPGRKGMVTSPYAPEEAKYVDVTGFASGSVVKDPYTGKFFLVP